MAEPTSSLLERTRRDFATTLGIAGAITLFINLGALFVPIYNIQLYDRVMQSRSMETLAVLGAACILGTAIYGILEFARSCLFLVLGDRLTRRLNVPALVAAIESGLAGDDSVAGQALRDLNDIRGFVTGSAAAIPLDLLAAPAILAVLYLLHPAYFVLGLACAATLLAVSLATDLATTRRLAHANAAAAKQLNELSGALAKVELLDGMGMLPALTRAWQRRHAATLDELDRTTRRLKVCTVAGKTLRLAMQAGVIALGAMLVLDQNASPGSMMGASLLLAKLLVPFDQLVGGWRQWVFARAAWRRIAALLLGSRHHRGTVVAPLVDPAPSIVVERLGYWPEGATKPVLDDVSFVLEAGEAIGIVGASGAGKSTLVRLLLGLLPPTSGRVVIDGVDTRSWDRAALGQRVGYLPQSVALLDATIFENIARMGDAEPGAVVEAARAAGIHEAIGRLPQGYSTWIGADEFVLSGGQRQRIALARALFGSPRLLILDEPNAHLDHFGERALIDTIREAKAAGAALVLVAHRPAVLGAADKILVLDNGRVERLAARETVLSATAQADLPPFRLAQG